MNQQEQTHSAATERQQAHTFDEEGEENQDSDSSCILIGNGEYTIVGIRYYSGVAHPGEFVNLVREPSNPYDRNAIRVDNMHGEKIGHIKKEMAKLIAPIMDCAVIGVRIEGTIPRKGDAYTLPVMLEFYSAAHATDQVLRAASQLEKALKRDYCFHLAREFSRTTAAATTAKTATPAVTVLTKKLDWNAQQEMRIEKLKYLCSILHYLCNIMLDIGIFS